MNHDIYTLYSTYNMKQFNAHLCSVYTYHTLYLYTMSSWTLSPTVQHTLPCHAPIIQSLQVAKEREKPMRKQLKALHYEATILLCTMKPPPLLAAHKIPEVPTKAFADKDFPPVTMPVQRHMNAL